MTPFWHDLQTLAAGMAVGFLLGLAVGVLLVVPALLGGLR